MLALLTIMSVLLAVSGGEVCPREDQIQRSGYDYGTFIPLQPYSSEPDLERKIRFSVRGSSDAHILLSDGCGCPAYSTYCDADNCQGYEIVIGGWGNSKSVIREEKQEDYYLTETPDILNPYEWREFWIRIEENPVAQTFTVEVGEEGEWRGFMERTWRIQFPFPTFIAFSTWYFKSIDFCGPFLSPVVSPAIGFYPPEPAFDPPAPAYAAPYTPPEYDILPVINCSSELPCYYGDGDCSEFGDESCQSGLVCGVNNCGDLEPGKPGSCCVQIKNTTKEQSRESRGLLRYRGGHGAPAPVPVGGFGEWTAWAATWRGWGRERGRLAWPDHCHLQTGECPPQYQYETQTLE